MSEQIDKAKLLEWLKDIHKKQTENRDKLPVDHHYWEYHEGAADYLKAVIKQIESGKFDK